MKQENMGVGTGLGDEASVMSRNFSANVDKALKELKETIRTNRRMS
jgi:hypothetical protein